MRTFNWLKRIRESERGNALAIGAATLPLLLGSAAFTVDTIHFGLMKRQLQRAADFERPGRRLCADAGRGRIHRRP